MDNGNAPFQPRLDHYPHLDAAHSLMASQGAASSRLEAYARSLCNTAGSSGAQAEHPFADEIRGLKYEGWQLEGEPPQLPRSLDETPFQFIDTVQGLHEMAAALSAAKHVAIDLENHSFR